MEELWIDEETKQYLEEKVKTERRQAALPQTDTENFIQQATVKWQYTD